MTAQGAVAERDSGRAMMWSGLAWALSYFAARFALEGDVLAGWARVAVALAPLPFFVAFLAAFIRNVRAMDELERRIQLEALGIAFPLALVLVMTLGLVQVARPLDPANWSYRHLWPFMAAFYAAGLAVARRRYL